MPTGRPADTAAVQETNLTKKVLIPVLSLMCTRFKKAMISGTPDPAAPGCTNSTTRPDTIPNNRHRPTWVTKLAASWPSLSKLSMSFRRAATTSCTTKSRKKAMPPHISPMATNIHILLLV
jgi:hypothetical protein